MDHGVLQLAGHCDRHTDSTSARYQPSIADVFKVRRYLQKKFPVELVDRIIDDASYWPHSSVYLERPLILQSHAGGGEMTGMYMRTLPLGIPGTEGDFNLVKSDHNGGSSTAWTRKLKLGEVDGPSRYRLTPRLLHPCRKIEFQIWSHDQGWGGGYPGTYRGSYTWFDAGVQKLQASMFADNIVEWPTYLLYRSDEELCSTPADPRPRTFVQANFVASSQTREHTIVWHYLDSYNKESPEAKEAVNQGRGPGTLDGKFVRDMEVGDCVILWARAMFPGWANHVQRVKITTYWAV